MEAKQGSVEVLATAERQTGSPSLETSMVQLAEVVEVLVGELAGRKPVAVSAPSVRGRLWRRLPQIERLPVADRKAIFRVFDGLLARYKLCQHQAG